MENTNETTRLPTQHDNKENRRLEIDLESIATTRIDSPKSPPCADMANQKMISHIFHPKPAINDAEEEFSIFKDGDKGTITPITKNGTIEESD